MLDIYLDVEGLRAALLKAGAAFRRFAKHQAKFMGKARRKMDRELRKTWRQHIEERHRGRGRR